MAKISDLPVDLLEEILCRIPWTKRRRRAVRATCKKWNTLYKDKRFTKKHLAQVPATDSSKGDFVGIVLMNGRLNLMRVNLHNDSLKSIGKLTRLKVHMSGVFHCNGLLLCTTLDNTKLFVWNPYTSQKLWISVEHKSVVSLHCHALGYDENHTFKILRYVRDQSMLEIYELNSTSGSWRVLDISSEKYDLSYGLSLKGNTYWCARKGNTYWCDRDEKSLDFLLCFDFRRECFGPRLPLPFECNNCHDVILSSVRDEQLAVLLICDTCEIKVWITTKIEPNAVCWSKFLAFDMEPFYPYTLDGRFDLRGSFLIDKEREAVVLFDDDKRSSYPDLYVAYIIGQDRDYGEVDLEDKTRDPEDFSIACSSYVPSSVQINQPA